MVKTGALKKFKKKDFSSHDPREPRLYFYENEANYKMSDIDFSAQDFNKARSVIDAASRNFCILEKNSKPIYNNKYLNHNNRRIHQLGDTTIITEHRDPYSFYWQLDQQKKKQDKPQRSFSPTDYVIDLEKEYESPEVIGNNFFLNFYLLEF